MILKKKKTKFIKFNPFTIYFPFRYFLLHFRIYLHLSYSLYNY